MEDIKQEPTISTIVDALIHLCYNQFNKAKGEIRNERKTNRGMETFYCCSCGWLLLLSLKVNFDYTSTGIMPVLFGVKRNNLLSRWYKKLLTMQ